MLPAETVKKRIQLARRTLEEANVTLDLPPAEQLDERLNTVHDVLCLMFNEGYSTSFGQEPIRDNICEEAARLCHLLCNSDFVVPSTKALLALFLFNASRLDAGTDVDGTVILLKDKDRSQWDAFLIRSGGNWLSKSKTDRPGIFHLEAAIAMQHSTASSVDSTDWNAIVQLYDRLSLFRESPVYILNRAVAVGQAGDPHLALQQLRTLKNHPRMMAYPLLECACSRMHELLGDPGAAAECLTAALALTTAPHEKQLLEKKLQSLIG